MNVFVHQYLLELERGRRASSCAPSPVSYCLREQLVEREHPPAAASSSPTGANDVLVHAGELLRAEPSPHDSYATFTAVPSLDEPLLAKLGESLDSEIGRTEQAIHKLERALEPETLIRRKSNSAHVHASSSVGSVDVRCATTARC